MLLERKRATLSVVLPAREVADTVGPIVERILSLEGLVDQVLVVDADSGDGSGRGGAARGRRGASGRAELLPELGPVLGKGDAMYRALAAVHGRAAWSTSTPTRATSPRSS